MQIFSQLFLLIIAKTFPHPSSIKFRKPSGYFWKASQEFLEGLVENFGRLRSKVYWVGAAHGG